MGEYESLPEFGQSTLYPGYRILRDGSKEMMPFALIGKPKGKRKRVTDVQIFMPVCLISSLAVKERAGVGSRHDWELLRVYFEKGVNERSLEVLQCDAKERLILARQYASNHQGEFVLGPKASVGLDLKSGRLIINTDPRDLAIYRAVAGLLDEGTPYRVIQYHDQQLIVGVKN